MHGQSKALHLLRKVCKDDLIIEIGPGLGNLTSPLLENAGKVICIELDPKMVHILKDRFSLYKNFELIHNDVLKVDLKTLIENNLNSANENYIEAVENFHDFFGFDWNNSTEV